MRKSRSSFPRLWEANINGLTLKCKQMYWHSLEQSIPDYVLFLNVSMSHNFISGPFRVILVIELGCPQDLGKMPWHFYNKQTYFKL